MKKTKIAFEDIKAGDLLEVVVVDGGAKQVVTGIAFQLEEINAEWQDSHSFWSTSEGSMIAVKGEALATIYRIDVAEVKFEDIRKGDRVLVTERDGIRTTTTEATAVLKIDGGFNPYWLDSTGEVIAFRLSNPSVKRTIEILEREGE